MRDPTAETASDLRSRTAPLASPFTSHSAAIGKGSRMKASAPSVSAADVDPTMIVVFRPR